MIALALKQIFARPDVKVEELEEALRESRLETKDAVISRNKAIKQKIDIRKERDRLRAENEALRAIVASVLGDTVQVPKELCQ